MVILDTKPIEGATTLIPYAKPLLRDGMPRYRSIREQLLKQILDGKLGRGQSLPSESEMAAEYGVSLGTMRKAIDGLVEQNVLVRQQGKNTFIATRDSATSIRLNFHIVANDDIKQLPAFLQVLSIEPRSANLYEALRLGLEVGGEITEMKRTRVFSDKSIMIEYVYLPKKLFPNFGKRLGASRPALLYELYEEKFGVSVLNFEERVRAVKSTAEDEQLLGCKRGCALLEIERVAFDFDSKPVEMRISRCESSKRYYFNERR